MHREETFRAKPIELKNASLYGFRISCAVLSLFSRGAGPMLTLPRVARMIVPFPVDKLRLKRKLNPM